jgi:soluble lytic murein transglycosylase-like protein
MERDVLKVASRDHDIVRLGWRKASGLNKDDALSALTTAIVRMAEGEDISPSMREMVASFIYCDDVRLDLRQAERQGREPNPARDGSIAKYVAQKLAANPKQRKKIFDRAAQLFGVKTTRAIELAIQRHERRQAIDDDF